MIQNLRKVKEDVALYEHRISSDGADRQEADSEIWERFKGGDDQAFIDIYQTYFDKLYNYAFQFANDDQLIKDCIQDLFVYLRVRRKKLGQVRSIKFYLFKSLQRKILKARKKIESDKAAMAGNFSVEFVSSTEDKLIERYVEDSKLKLLSTSIKSLSQKQREGIIYFFYEGFSYEQVAELMGYRNAKQARKLVYRAVDALRQRIKPGGSLLSYLLTF